VVSRGIPHGSVSARGDQWKIVESVWSPFVVEAYETQIGGTHEFERRDVKVESETRGNCCGC
jgi:hypothetical protein